MDRLQQQQQCACEANTLHWNAAGEPGAHVMSREEAYVRVAEEKFTGINRCC
jgi:hypothetical protein